MLNLSDLSKHVADYRQEQESFDDFVDWFRDGSRGYSRHIEMGPAIAAVEAALSKYYFQGRDEMALRRELENAIRHFALQPEMVARPYVVTKPQEITLEFDPIQRFARKPMGNVPMAFSVHEHRLYCG